MKDTGAQGRRRWRPSRLLRIAITVLLLAGLAYMVDWRRTLALAADARWGFILAAVGCVVLARASITLRWGLLLRLGGLKPRFGDLYRIVSGSMAFASLLPSSLGADVARGAFLGTGMAGQVGARPTEVVASIAADRYAATLGTLLVAAVASAFAGFAMISAATLAAVVAVLAVTYVILRGSNALIRAVTPGPLQRVRPKVEALMALIRRPGMIRRGVLPAVAISMLVTLLRTCIFISLYYALGQQIPLGLAFFAIPMMIIALMIPLTIGGFGIREWLLVLSFESAGVSAEVSIAVGLLAFAIQTLVSIPPLLALIVRRRPAPSAGPTPETERHSK